MFHLIKPDINVDFMGARKKAFTVSGILVVASLALIAFKGFDLGIDFKGGSSAIVAFKDGTANDHSAIETTVSEFIAASLQRPDSQVSVQDFGAGAGDTRDGVAVDRLLIYTEITTMVDAERRTKIVEAFQSKWKGARIASSEDSGDTLYVTFAEDADIASRRQEIVDLLKTFEYQKVTVTSDFERQIEVEFLRDIELEQQDKKATDNTAGAETTDAAAGLDMSQLEQRKAEAVAGKSDKRFTVEIEAFQAALEAHLATKFPDRFIAVESAATVSASVGEDLFNDGMLAILYSLVGILIYVTLRFDFRYAPGAVLSLAHDAIVTMGFVALFDMKFGLTIVASILTVIGYSINDTIIVYDRIRETAGTQSGKGMLEVLNRAVNNTLSRTIFTSGTTLFSSIAIMLFGGATIFDFGASLTFGVAIGTYSSIYVAAPFIYYLDNMQKKRAGDKDESGPRRNRITRDDSKSDKSKKKPADATA